MANTRKRFQLSSARAESSRGRLLFRRVTTITRSASPSTRTTPAIPLLECCRAHSFQLWSSASSLRIRWNELALRNRKASLPPFVLSPSLPNPSTLLSPPPLRSLSLSLSLLHAPPSLPRFHAREPLRFPFPKAVFLHATRSYARSNETRNVFPQQLSLAWTVQLNEWSDFRDGNDFEIDSNIVSFDAAHRYGYKRNYNSDSNQQRVINADEATFPSSTRYSNRGLIFTEFWVGSRKIPP